MCSRIISVIVRCILFLSLVVYCSTYPHKTRLKITASKFSASEKLAKLGMLVKHRNITKTDLFPSNQHYQGETGLLTSSMSAPAEDASQQTANETKPFMRRALLNIFPEHDYDVYEDGIIHDDSDSDDEDNRDNQDDRSHSESVEDIEDYNEEDSESDDSEGYNQNDYYDNSANYNANNNSEKVNKNDDTEYYNQYENKNEEPEVYYDDTESHNKNDDTYYDNLNYESEKLDGSKDTGKLRVVLNGFNYKFGTQVNNKGHDNNKEDDENEEENRDTNDDDDDDHIDDYVHVLHKDRIRWEKYRSADGPSILELVAVNARHKKRKWLKEMAEKKRLRKLEV